MQGPDPWRVYAKELGVHLPPRKLYGLCACLSRPLGSVSSSPNCLATLFTSRRASRPRRQAGIVFKDMSLSGLQDCALLVLDQARLVPLCSFDLRPVLPESFVAGA